ncbi:MAG TPA: hypothetical protein VIL65_01690 [Beijerinckiaceae bacterium]|jgi:hypothetical protein
MDHSHDRSFTALIWFFGILSVPLAVCVLILLVEPGINRSFFYESVKMAAILVAIGGALSFGASLLAGKVPNQNQDR